MPQSSNVASWRVATSEELISFTEGKVKGNGLGGSYLVIRSKLTQIDVYTYLRARFGMPNGFMNFLRKDDSDNLIHWDFNVRSGEVDVYIQGRMRDVVIMVSEVMADEDWKNLILKLKADFGRIGAAKSQMLKSFEKFLVFQNKFNVLANLCGDLHASIVDAPEMVQEFPRFLEEADMEKLKSAMDDTAKRATNLYGDCLKLRLLMPIMAEAFLNMVILTLSKDEIRNNRKRYDAFVREKIPQRVAQLSTNCIGFECDIDKRSEGYRGFMRVMNTRNFSIHGNIDPVREPIETVYFEGRRPLFTDNGDHLFKLFQHLERINAPQVIIRDYEVVHLFLAEIVSMLAPSYREFFERVIEDPYPGYEVKTKRVTKILPSYNAVMLLPGERYDDDLRVVW